jgi:hypothetical protein
MNQQNFSDMPTIKRASILQNSISLFFKIINLDLEKSNV